MNNAVDYIKHYRECCDGNIEWEGIESDDGGVYYPGTCPNCGTNYQEVWVKVGIVEKESQVEVE